MFCTLANNGYGLHLLSHSLFHTERLSTESTQTHTRSQSQISTIKSKHQPTAPQPQHDHNHNHNREPRRPSPPPPTHTHHTASRGQSHNTLANSTTTTEATIPTSAQIKAAERQFQVGRTNAPAAHCGPLPWPPQRASCHAPRHKVLSVSLYA